MHMVLVDDEPAILQSVGAFLRDLGHDVSLARSAQEALAQCARDTQHVVLTDITMPDMDGLTLLTRLKQTYGAALDVIVFTGQGEADLAIRALRAGAFDYLKKPLNIEELAIALERVEEHLALRTENRALTTHFTEVLKSHLLPLHIQLQNVQQVLYAELGLDKLYLFSEAMQRVFERAGQFGARRDVPILIEGESGTGKELVARYIHCQDTTLSGPFVALNCGALSSELCESELLGYEGGAFTGARARGSAGKLELAQNGTLFLDEIGEMSLEVQAHLLRLLETREYYRVGGLKKLHTNARFVFATNRILANEVAQGRFRRDLYYRLNVGHLVVPPLRERREEIPPLASALLAELGQKHSKYFRGLTAAAQRYLRAQPWEGNVRELRNVLERAVILARGAYLDVADFDAELPPPAGLALLQADADWELPPEHLDLAQLELAIVRRALAKHHNNKTQTATYLGLSLKALRNRLRKLPTLP